MFQINTDQSRAIFCDVCFDNFNTEQDKEAHISEWHLQVQNQIKDSELVQNNASNEEDSVKCNVSLIKHKNNEEHEDVEVSYSDETVFKLKSKNNEETDEEVVYVSTEQKCKKCFQLGHSGDSCTLEKTLRCTIFECELCKIRYFWPYPFDIYIAMYKTNTIPKLCIGCFNKM